MILVYIVHELVSNTKTVCDAKDPSNINFKERLYILETITKITTTTIIIIMIIIIEQLLK